MPGGDPAVLDDCGNTLMTASVDLDGARTSMTGVDTLTSDVLGRGGWATDLEAAYSRVCASVATAAENLQATMAEDGYYLQRGGRDVDSAMNQCAPPPGSSHGRIPV